MSEYEMMDLNEKIVARVYKNEVGLVVISFTIIRLQTVGDGPFSDWRGLMAEWWKQ
jgi:hypothetical protein